MPVPMAPMRMVPVPVFVLAGRPLVRVGVVMRPRVDVLVRVGVFVGVGVAVLVGMDEVAVAVLVAVPVGVRVGVAVLVGMSVRLGMGVAVAGVDGLVVHGILPVDGPTSEPALVTAPAPDRSPSGPPLRPPPPSS